MTSYISFSPSLLVKRSKSPRFLESWTPDATLKTPALSIPNMVKGRIKSLGQRTLWHTVKRGRSLVKRKWKERKKNTWMAPLLKAITSLTAIKVSTMKHPAVDFNATFVQHHLTPKSLQREPPHYIKTPFLLQPGTFPHEAYLRGDSFSLWW